MVLNKDFREFIQLLNDHRVHYLIVGGYAVAFHGHPRYTKDIDIWIWLDQGNADKILRVLEAFGFSSLDLTADDFMEPNQIIQLGHPPNRIDLLTSLNGIEFQECYATRINVTVEGTVIHFIDLENLKKNKRATARYQDLADLEKLE